MIVYKTECVIGGRTLSIEVGRMARQANGAALVRFADTVVLAAVTASDLRDDFDFFPLTVDYREKTYAAGKFPGGFIKREGRPTTKETLTMRLIDRPLRPLFRRNRACRSLRRSRCRCCRPLRLRRRRSKRSRRRRRQWPVRFAPGPAIPLIESTLRAFAASSRNAFEPSRGHQPTDNSCSLAAVRGRSRPRSVGRQRAVRSGLRAGPDTAQDGRAIGGEKHPAAVCPGRMPRIHS